MSWTVLQYEDSRGSRSVERICHIFKRNRLRRGEAEASSPLPRWSWCLREGTRGRAKAATESFKPPLPRAFEAVANVFGLACDSRIVVDMHNAYSSRKARFHSGQIIPSPPTDRNIDYYPTIGACEINP
jgi:hypothetical protein